MSINKKSYSLRTKLASAILIFMLGPILIISYKINDEIGKELRENFIASTTTEIANVDLIIDTYIESIKEDVTWLSELDQVKEANGNITSYAKSYSTPGRDIQMTPSKNGRIEREIYEQYRRFGETHPEFSYIFMGTVDGGFIQWPEKKIYKGYDPRIRPWYKLGMEHKDEVSITSAYYYSSEDVDIISIVKTIRDKQGEIKGVQAIDVSLSQLTEIIRNIKIGKRGYMIVADSQGTILSHPKITKSRFKKIAHLSDIGVNKLNKIENGSKEIIIEDKPHVVNVYTSPKTGWKFIAVIEKNELFENVNRIQNYIIFLIIVTIIIAIIVSNLFSKGFLKPLLILEKQIKSISNENFSLKLPHKMFLKKDEMGSLANSIDKMQNRLEQLIMELKNSEMNLIEKKREIKENYNFLYTLIEAIPNPLFYKDKNGIYRYCNHQFVELIGLEKDKIINHTVFDIMSLEQAKKNDQRDAELMQSENIQQYENIFKHQDGTQRNLNFNKAIYRDEKHQVKGIVGVILDITEQKSNEKRMMKLLRVKEAMLEISHCITENMDLNKLFDLILDKAINSIDETDIGTVLILDEQNNLKINASRGYEIEKANQASFPLEKSFGWIETNGNINHTVIVNDLDQFKNLTVLPTIQGQKIKSVISGPIIIEGKLYGFINIDSYYNDIFTQSDFELMEYIRTQVALAISKHKLYEKIIYLSRYDKLTMFYNRSYFEELFEKKLGDALKNKEELYIILFDLNNLKGVNDIYGHLVGDQYIKVFAENLKKYIGYMDIIGRIGGDEFVCVLGDCNLKEVNEKMEQLSMQLENHGIKVEHDEIICSFSYGVACFPTETDSKKDIVRMADERMYEHKREMKSKKRFY